MTRSTRSGSAMFRPVASTISRAVTPVDNRPAIINIKACGFRCERIVYVMNVPLTDRPRPLIVLMIARFARLDMAAQPR
jgi:hypothetical protein